MNACRYRSKGHALLFLLPSELAFVEQLKVSVLAVSWPPIVLHLSCLVVCT